MHDHELSHLPGRQRWRLAWLGDEQELVLGIHGVGVVAPASPELGAEGNAEVAATGDTEMLQRGDADEGSGHGGDVEGDVRAEALAHEDDPGSSVGRDLR